MNLKDTYNKLANDYAKDHEEDNWWKGGVNKFISFLKKGDAVLDVGCGTGLKTKYLVENGLDVTGIDFADRLIAIAKRRVSEAKFFVDDVYSLESATHLFDGIFAQAIILHIPKKDVSVILQKLLERLKVGGYIYIGLKEKKAGGKDEENKKENNYGYEYERFFSYFTAEEIKVYLTNLGLNIVYLNFTNSGKADWIQVIAQR